MMSNQDLIELLGGLETVNVHIRELAEPIARQRKVTVDELLQDVCYSEGSEYKTTYAEAYLMAYLQGVRTGMKID